MIFLPAALSSTIRSQRTLSYSSGSMKSGSEYERQLNMWQSLHSSSDSNCFLLRHHVCMKWCSRVEVLPHARQSGNFSLRFQLADHSSTVMILRPAPRDGLISTGSPFMIFFHSQLCTVALGSALTSVYTSARRSSAYAWVQSFSLSDLASVIFTILSFLLLRAGAARGCERAVCSYRAGDVSVGRRTASHNSTRVNATDTMQYAYETIQPKKNQCGGVMGVTTAASSA
mmetsp:Transcript_33756/g.82838  ORF Transcript_33756/g.82838 Transcript_33756/m.82838 type:complete len:229 (-) Transcript_33756:144-830(-)